jgi:hypothetical protein
MVDNRRGENPTKNKRLLEPSSASQALRDGGSMLFMRQREPCLRRESRVEGLIQNEMGLIVSTTTTLNRAHERVTAIPTGAPTETRLDTSAHTLTNAQIPTNTPTNTPTPTKPTTLTSNLARILTVTRLATPPGYCGELITEKSATLKDSNTTRQDGCRDLCLSEFCGDELCNELPRKSMNLGVVPIFPRGDVNGS